MTEVTTETTEQAPPVGGVPVSGGSAVSTPVETPQTNGNGTILDEPADGKEAPATWPTDWRERWAGKDEKFLKTLQRYSSPDNVAKAYGSLRQQLSAGELIKKLPADASPEQVAEWRDQMGVPAEAAGYKLPVIPGHEWAEEDKPILSELMQVAHSANLDQGKLDALLSWYAANTAKAEEATFAQDDQARKELEDNLRTEWGPEYRSNIGLMRRYLESNIPDAAGAALLDARLDNGGRLIDQPWFAKWVVDLARDTYGEGSFVTGEGVAALGNRKKEIQNIMHTDPNRYHREGLGKEYLEIVKREERSRR